MSPHAAAPAQAAASEHAAPVAAQTPAPRTSTDSTHESVHELQRQAGNEAVLTLLRPLRTPDERSERDADLAARASLRAEPALGALRPLRTARASDRFAGRRLPGALRGYFERQLGYDLGGVRVATAARAAGAARRLGARAFASGREIAFGDREFRPGTPQGRTLLAHELAHVIQQARGRRAALQLQPKQKRGYEIPKFEYTGGVEQATTEKMGGWVDLSWDEVRGEFACTFRLFWRSFPADPPHVELGWGKPENQAIFKNRFMAAIRGAWENRYPLVEYAAGDATGRAAKVVLRFEEVNDTTPTTVSEITRRSQLPAEEAERLRSRFDIEVSLQKLREFVAMGSMVQIGAYSLEPEEFKLAKLRDKEKYGHYAREKLTLDVPAKRKSFEQVAAVHEFGHMIGLADEYVMSEEDYGKAKTALGETEAKRRLRERTKATGRVMNIGSEITPDQYRPFARWLSDLTAGDWRVQGDAGPQKRPAR